MVGYGFLRVPMPTQSRGHGTQPQEFFRPQGAFRMPFPLLLTRRQALKSAACGFGYLAFAGLAQEAAAAVDPLAPKLPRFPARAQRVIFIFMQGGPSHVDTFDY